MQRQIIVSFLLFSPFPSHIHNRYSFPNLLPLPAFEVERIRDRVLKLNAFDRLYGPFPTSFIDGQAKQAVIESADRYLKSLAGEYHRRNHQGKAGEATSEDNVDDEAKK